MSRCGRSGWAIDDIPRAAGLRAAPGVEVLIGVQFVPLPQFGMREAVTVSRAFKDRDVMDVVPTRPRG